MSTSFISSRVTALALAWPKYKKEYAPIRIGKGGHTFFDTPLSSLLIPLSTDCVAISQHNRLSGRNSERAYGGTEVSKTLIYKNYSSRYQSSTLLGLAAMLYDILGSGWPKMATCSGTITQFKIS
jgi:hypothetical protein